MSHETSPIQGAINLVTAIIAGSAVGGAIVWIAAQIMLATGAL